MITLDAQTIYGFSNSLLVPRYDNPQPTPMCHLEWWDLMCDPHPKVALAAPRGHAKTTACTHAFVLANICFRVKTHVLIISDTEGQAVDFLRDIKHEFIENELLIKTFKFDRIIKDSATEFIGQFEDGHQFRIIIKGSEQRVRGIKWRNQRPDLVVGDDLENDEIVLNEERRRKFKKWFYSAVLPVGGDNCDFRIVGTILHMDSVLENLMPKWHADTTCDDGIKQWSTDPTAIWKGVRYRAHNEDFSKILWEEKFPRERLEEQRRDYIESGNPEGYAQEYLNYPIDEATAYFKESDFKDISSKDDNEDYYVAADLAISQKDGAAYSVFAVVGVNAEGKVRVKEVIRERMDGLEIIDTLFALEIGWSPEIFFVEEENIARTLGPLIEREMQRRGIYLTIQGMTASQDKPKRAKPLQAMMRSGAIEFDKEADWYPDLLTEFLQFPRGKYVDQIDALAWIPIGIRSVVDAKTFKQLEDEEYERELEQYGESSYMHGRSYITGY